MHPATRRSPSGTERGSALLLTVVFMAIAMGALVVTMTQQDRSAAVDVGVSEARIRALELAETGLARAALEIASNVDSASDGVGVVSGVYAGGTYAVTATHSGAVWTLVATGRSGKASRRVEQGVRRVSTSPFAAAILADGDVTLSSGGTQTDSYDSRLGTYASQATNTDAWGAYAGTAGSIGTNDDITISGARVRGDAVPGVSGTTTTSGGGAVTGSVVPRSAPLSLPPTPLADFQAALSTNANGSWTWSGGAVTYDAVTKDFTASGGAVVTFPAGTYFFAKFKLSGGSTAVFPGPTKIYAVAGFDASGGSVVNSGCRAADLLVYAHPYVFTGVTTASPLNVKLSGGAGSALALYAPEAALTVSGGSSVFGSLVADTVTLSGGTAVHYDAALGDGAGAAALVQQLYWRESTPPIP